MVYTTSDYEARITARAEAWRTQAACRGLDPARFFTRIETEAWEVGRSVCTRCPVQFECLEYAIMKPEEYGVWGGATEAQRARLRRRVVRSFETATLATLDDAQALVKRELARPWRRRPGRPVEDLNQPMVS